MKKKQIAMLIFIAIIAVFLVVSFQTPGTIADRETYQCGTYATIWSLLPPVIAIGLALVTKEVYTSLLAGIITGALLYANFNLELMINTMLFNEEGGMVYKLSDSGNVGILVFLVMLGILVSLLNRAGGSAAFGKWASKHIKTRIGAQISVMILGVLIFVDDYFNCLTVGSVMRPVTDRHKVSRAKLSYIIDATAAPVCIIAPISSWAAAVTGFVEGANGLELFIRAIPYNFYALLTIVMMLTLTFAKFDYGPMRMYEMSDYLNKNEEKRVKASITGAEKQPNEEGNPNGRVIHLVFPIIVLIVCCVIGMIYTGGFFDGVSFVDAFSGSNASLGLTYGSVIAMILTIIFFLATRVMKFTECMDAIPEGFKSMVPAILILTFAWTLKAMTDSLGAQQYVAALVRGSAGSFLSLLPAIIFLIGCGLSFATGTSWGTFGILIPIVVNVFDGNLSNELMIISISACMAGAVCGDHCSPISDTTIMASAGAQCVHIDHVTTQLPYAMTAAAVSFVAYIIAGFIRSWLICLPIGIVLMVGTLLIIRAAANKNGK